MAKANITTTTLMGKVYEGLPTGLAFRLWKYEQDGQPEMAVALLNAKNRIRAAFGGQPHNLADDFTTLPMEGWMIVRAA